MRQCNFGCGTNIMHGFDNLDLKDFDFNHFPYPIKSNTHDYIYSRHVLEHLREPERVLNELHRVCKDGAIIDIICPHLNNVGAFSMLGHISYFDANTFRCLVIKEGWRPVKGWRIIFTRERPTWFGKLIFIPYIRKRLSKVINGIYCEVIVRLEVLK